MLAASYIPPLKHMTFPCPQLRFPSRMLRLKADSETLAVAWETELNKAHMSKVNGSPSSAAGGGVGSPRVGGNRGTVAMDSPSKSMARQVCALVCADQGGGDLDDGNE